MAAPPAARRPGLGQAAARARAPTRTRRAAAGRGGGDGGSGPRRWPALSRSIGEPSLVHGHPHAAASAEGHAPAGSPGVAAPTSFRVPTGVRRGKPRRRARLRLNEACVSRARPTPRTEETRRENLGRSFPHLAGGRLRGGEREGGARRRAATSQPRICFRFQPSAQGMTGVVV